jgi:hypothetical protein
MYVTLQSSTCFEHQHAHLHEDKLYYRSIWYRHSLYSTVQYSHLQRVTIPDAVIIQFALLKMGMLMLETCRGL